MNARLASGITLLAAIALWGCPAKTSKVVTCPSGQTASSDGTCCPTGLIANSSNVCVECLKNSDCSAGDYCDSNGNCNPCDGGNCTSGGDAGPAPQCTKDSDCGAKNYCAAGSCVPGCSVDSECITGETCQNHSCILGCDMGSKCATGLECCGDQDGGVGICTNTMSLATANCGGCGMPACTTGDLCCNGACTDTTSDPNNCGACGTACGGSIQCANSTCQEATGVVALFDVTGNVYNAADGGLQAVQALAPLVYFEPGAVQVSTMNIGALEALLTCTGYHYSPTTTPVAPSALNAGLLKITGYTPGTLINGMMASSEIDCLPATTGGVYQCGYGPVDGTTLGAQPGETWYPATPQVFTTTTAITFTAAGGPADGGTFGPDGGGEFGSFTEMATVLSNATGEPGSSIPTVEDLSTLKYTGTGNVTIDLDCPGGSTSPDGGTTAGNCGAGVMIVFVQATSNAAASFEDPATSYGYLECLSTFGSEFGQNLGPNSSTITQSAIQAMLGGDTTLTTFTTTVATLSLTQAQALTRGTDSQGHNVIAVVGEGTFGISATH